ncbi:hypothetical protein [Streptomyces sp. WAC06614]|uniref:hypothetical protein n=1 Tax=Streptomyces sp. WAC06614 TaxID=2487416 RepID=UPI000F7B08BE|nr:hypothetical protein [Streptomyces sp. WAC06614]RSS76705.1 hypothetical protein EF918_23285 [Streptomyces sp. WAC06614]
MNLRLIGIGAGVLIILSLPLAGAIAGPDFGGRRDPGHGGLISSLGLPGAASRTGGRAVSPSAAGETAGAAARDTAGDAKSGAQDGARTESRCGPELSSPHGVEAQTCVLTADGQTWGRSYYRNTSGHPLDAVLTLMGPAGRTWQIRCAVDAGDEPGLCETPREKSTGARDGWTAVAEFAVPDDEGPLLLRSGSNSPAPAER